MQNSTSWHSFPKDKVCTVLATHEANGIDTASIEKLQKKYGLNKLEDEAGFYVFRAVLKQLKSPLALVLVAAGVATLVLGEWLDATVVFVALLINIGVGVLQEGKAARVFDALAKSQEKHATVIRDGKQQIVSSESLVPGDVVVLTGGSLIPADIRLIEVNNFAVNEAALTGEWLPVEKISETVGRALPVGEQKNMAWMGTLVAEGFAKGVVVATGHDARFGKIAKSTREEMDTMTPLQENVHTIVRFLMFVIGIALALILILGLIRGEPFGEMLLLAIAVAVAAMPEGLPAAVTVVLALGMEAVLRKGGLVKNLLAAETLGSTTIVLTDKTGTLTQGKMLLNGLYTAQGFAKENIEAVEDNRELLKMAVLSSDAFIDRNAETGADEVHGRPLEKAIIERGLIEGLKQNELFLEGNERIDFVQFESSRRYAISLNATDKKTNKLYFSGSPELLLERSEKYYFNGRERKLDEKTRLMFKAAQAHISAKGMRFTAMAYLKTKGDSVPEEVVKTKGGAKNYVFVGMVAFSDSVRPDVPQAIRETQEAGARVIMATGDYPETARAIALEVGIVTDAEAPVLTGTMVAEMTDPELTDALREYSVVARVLPEQKLRIARLLRNSGEIVSMTGDGVNDAPALVAADIGIAVGSGTDVAKAAADMILIDNSFSVITAAIKEGRRIIANIQKIVTYLLSTSFSEIIVIGGALAVGAPLPLLPAQILWANIIGEGFMSFPFAFEPAEKGVMKQRPTRRGTRGILTGHVRWFIFTVSGITGTLLLALFFLLYSGGVPTEKIQTVMFVALSFYSILFAFSFKDLSQPIWKISFRTNIYLIASFAGSLAVLFLAITTAPLQKLLSITPLTLQEIAILLVLAFINLALIEGAKLFLRKKIKA